jgi:replicative DNA helicase Mcm
MYVEIVAVPLDSMSPGVMGYPEIKLSLLAAAVGGGKNHNKALREYAHIAVVGDPGTAKTILVESLRLLVPRAQYAAGKGASGVGLTVAAVKDDMGGGGYIAQAGALVLADRGLMIIDELDMFEPEDIQRLNTALESGCFPVNKGGINQTFNSRCPVIAILNPKLICFDKDVDLDEQINIPADTLSRFDLIFKIKDVVEEERDTKLAEHMGKRWKALCTDNGDIKGKIPLETMRKYLAFAKSFQPKLSDEVILRINEYYVKEIRQKHRGGPRDYNAIARITKAITKLRLSDVCTIEDVEQAIALHTASQKAIEDPTTGTIDSRILYGYNSSQVERNKLIIGSIRDIGHNGDGVHFTDILTKVASLNITSDQLSDTIHKLRFSGEIIEIEDHVFRVI